MEKLSKNHLSKILKYKQKKFIQKDNYVLVEGYRLLNQISEYNITFEELYVSKNFKNELTNFKFKKIYETPEYFFSKISNTKTPQNIAALIKYNKPNELKDFKKFLYLYEISDPGNLGTIIRSAVAFSFDAIILSENSVYPLNDKVIRASMGAVFYIPIFIKDIDFLQKTKAKILVADNSKESINIKKVKKNLENFIIVIGSEAFGVPNKIKKLADLKIKIPIKNIESLNAAISAAIFMYEFYENTK